MKPATIRSAIFCMMLAGPAAAFPGVLPDPNAGDSTHYQVDLGIPVQDRLEDCFLFEVQAHGTRLHDIRRDMLWACQAIAARHATGSRLDDRMAANERALLDYERTARDWMRGIHTASQASPGPRGTASAVIATGWRGYRNIQQDIIEALALDLILALE